MKSERRIVKKQPQEELKSEDAADHIARFVAGEIESRDVAALPGVAAVLRGCGPIPRDDEPHPMTPDGAPPLAPVASPVSGVTVSDVPVMPPKPVCNLEELRSLTAKKFALGGVDLCDGSLVPSAKRPKPDGVVMARPAAAIPSGPSGGVMKKAAAAIPACVVMAKPAAACVVMAKPAAATPDLPKGWSYQLRSLNSGRRYPVWTSTTGKQFYSWKAAQRIV